MIPVKVVIQSEGGVKKVRDVMGRWATLEYAAQTPLRNLVNDFFKEQFRTRGRHGGHRWANLSSNTVAKKLAKGTYRRGVLRDSMRLHDALTRKNNPELRLVVGRKKFRFTVLVPYAKHHQRGTERMPARILLPDTMPDTFITQLRNRIKGYLVEGRFR